MVPTGHFARDAVAVAVLFKLRGNSGDHESVAKIRERILSAVTGSQQQDMVALNADIVPRLLDKVRPEAQAARRSTAIGRAAPPTSSRRHPSNGRTAGESARHDGRRSARSARSPTACTPANWPAHSAMARERWKQSRIWPGGRIYDLGQCYAYSDSASDLPMLEAVGHPVAVNPDAKLERIAHHNGWPIVVFSKRTKVVVPPDHTGTGNCGSRGRRVRRGDPLRHPLCQRRVFGTRR